MKKVLIAVGGTGGHIFPALAYAQELLEKSIQVHFIGAKLKANSYFQAADHPFTEVLSGKIVKNPFFMPFEGYKILAGIIKSFFLIKKFKPDLIVGFGSYHSFPPLMGAKLANKPILLHESNSIPGKVNRYLARHAVMTGLQFPQAKEHLKGASHPVRMPLRKQLLGHKSTKEEDRKYFGLDEAKRTLLIFGGSQGALVMNQLFLDAASFLKKKISHFQVIHFCGNLESQERLVKRYQQLAIVASVKPFEKNMEMAWGAADIVISRAGAMTIAEQIHFETPGVLIPYPYAADNHQEKNAYFMKGLGGALVRKESELTPESFSDAIENAWKQLPEMKMRLKEYKSLNNHESLADITIKILDL